MTNQNNEIPKNQIYHKEAINDPNVVQPIFFIPDCAKEGEDTFKRITPDTVKDIAPYYIMGNCSTIVNTRSGNEVKYKPRHKNDYENCSFITVDENGNRGRSTQRIGRLCAKLFIPEEGMEEKTVNHINGVKTDNYINKLMPDGTRESNLEWLSNADNIRHAFKTGANGSEYRYNITNHDVTVMRNMKTIGLSDDDIVELFDCGIMRRTIENINSNKTHHDPDYIPRTKDDPNYLIKDYRKQLSDRDKNIIKTLAEDGHYTKVEIRNKFYNTFSDSTIYRICKEDK